MVTKMKKKVSKVSTKKGQFLVVGTTIKIVLIVMVLVIGMSMLATQKDKMASISDSFLKLLAKLGFVHLSDNDAIALASMQATACAVDVVAKYAENVDAFNDADNIFEGIESCNAELFEDTALWNDGGTEVYTDSSVVVDSVADTEVEDDEVSDDSLPDDFIPLTLDVNEIKCGTVIYGFTIIGLNDDSVLLSVNYGTSSFDDTVIIGEGVQKAFDGHEDLPLLRNINFVNSDGKVTDGRIKCTLGGKLYRLTGTVTETLVTMI